MPIAVSALAVKPCSSRVISSRSASRSSYASPRLASVGSSAAADRNRCSIRSAARLTAAMNSSCLVRKILITYGWETPARRATWSVVVPA